jgi:hypothetical protein
MEQSLPVVLSASRRTDLVGCYPEYLIEKLKAYPPEKVHTIVIWTKNPSNLIYHQNLRDILATYSQIYIHLTITGLGGTPLEPRIPSWQDVAALLPQVAKLVGRPERISWRFDPIIIAEHTDEVIANFQLFTLIAQHIAQHGITVCRTSWASPYKKVTRRMQQKGFALKPVAAEEQKIQAHEMEKIAEQCGMQMHYCSMEGFERSSCIDGEALSRLHPDGLLCSVKRSKGQRTLCGCTESIDIGWYTLKCGHGCLYCYAEPQHS